MSDQPLKDFAMTIDSFTWPKGEPYVPCKIVHGHIEASCGCSQETINDVKQPMKLCPDHAEVVCLDCGWRGIGAKLAAQACPVCDGRVADV